MELAKDGLPEADGSNIPRRGGQHSFHERSVGAEPVTADLDVEIRIDEVGEEELVGEMVWLPRRPARRHRVELTVELASARPTEKCQIEQVAQPFRVRIGFGGR